MPAIGPRWKFTDPITADEYTFELSPTEGGDPPLKKRVNFQATAGPNGKVVLYEGRDEVQEMSVSGTLLTEDMHDALMEWADKRYQIYLTTDLEETFTIYITAYEPQRLRAANYRHRRKYTLRYIILDWDA